LDEWSGVLRLSEDYPEWAGGLGQRGVSVEARSLARSIWSFGPEYLQVADIVPGLGADLLVGGLWQLSGDLLTHPELMNDPGLLARRTAAGSLSNATTGLMGRGAAGGLAIVSTTFFGLTPPGWVVIGTGIAATVVIEVFWGEQIGQWWFERLNARAPWEEGGGR
jgi:hypothetical protein